MKRLTYSLWMASALATQGFAQERPNIILFLVDDMGVMDTSVPFLTDAEGLLASICFRCSKRLRRIWFPSDTAASPKFTRRN